MRTGCSNSAWACSYLRRWAAVTDLLSVPVDADVVRRNRQLDVVTLASGELAAAEKLLVLPSFVVAIHDHAGVKLCDGVEVVVLVFEILSTTSSAIFMRSLMLYHNRC